MVVDAKGQPRRGALLVNALQQGRAGGVTGDVACAQQFGKPNGEVEFAIVVDGRGIIRYAAYSSLIEESARAAEAILVGMRQQHEFATRHLDLFNVERLQLYDHGLHRKAVIAVSSDSDIQCSGGAQPECRGGSGCYAGESTASHGCRPKGLGVTLASSSFMAHLMASTYIFCMSGRSQFSTGWPRVE